MAKHENICTIKLEYLTVLYDAGSFTFLHFSVGI